MNIKLLVKMYTCGIYLYYPHCSHSTTTTITEETADQSFGQRNLQKPSADRLAAEKIISFKHHWIISLLVFGGTNNVKKIKG